MSRQSTSWPCGGSLGLHRGGLTSPCSRRAAARHESRREPCGPRPAAEWQLVRQPRSASRAAACALALLCAFGCASAPPDAPADLAGTYLFDSTQRIGDEPVRGIPLIPLAELLDRSHVEVVTLPNGQVAVTFTDTGNVQSKRVFEPGRESVRWSDGRLVYEGKPWYRGVPIVPGIASETLKVSLFREPERSLVVEWSYRESGMAGFLIPFVDSDKGTAILSPCAGAATSVAASKLEQQTDPHLIVPGQRVGKFVIGRTNATSIWEYKKTRAHEQWNRYVLGLDTRTPPSAGGVRVGSELQFELDSSGVLHGILVQSAEYITAEGLRVGTLATDVEAALGKPRARTTDQHSGVGVQVLDYGGIVFSTDKGLVTSIRVRQP